MNTLSATSVIAQNAEIVTANMNGETVMMRIETGKYYNLGTMGSVIWALLENPMSVEALIERLLEQYDVAREQCATEVMAFLSDAARDGLVKVMN